MERGLSRLRAVIVVFCGFVIVLCVAALLVVPPIARQITDLNRAGVGEDVIETLNRASELPIVEPIADWASGIVDENGNVIKRPNPWFKMVPKSRIKPSEADQDNSTPTGEASPSNESKKTKEYVEALVNKKGQIVDDPTPEELRAAEAYQDLVAKADFSERNLGYYLTQNAGMLSSTAFKWLKGGTGKILGFFGYAIGFAMVPIYLFYFLRESTSIKANWRNYVPLKASQFKDDVVETLAEINGYLISFFRGQVLVALIDGVLVGIALTIFRLPYGLVIGLFLAILGVIPFIGNILCMIPACIIAVVHFSGTAPNHQWLGSSPWAYVGAVIAIFLIVQQINSLVTAPKIVGDSVGLHPMTVIFSMLFWSLILGGFLGALLAVPLTAAVKVLVRRFIWERRIMDGPAVDQSA